MRTLRACFSIFRIKASEAFQYRVASLSAAVNGVFWVMIEIVVYTVFFHYSEHQGTNASLTLSQAVSYSWIGQILFMLQITNMNSDIHALITSGDVGIELCRPLPLYANWYSRMAADKLVPFLWRGIVILIAAVLMPGGLRLSPPASAAGLLAMLFSTMCALLFSTSFAMFICAVRMKIALGDGPVYILMLIGHVLSGAYLPLQLWPDFLQRFLLVQPFAGYLDIPVRLYLGTLKPQDASFAIGLQLAWTAVLIAIGKMLMGHRLKTIIIQGG